MLNLISDAWIPVRRSGGHRDTIRPDQIAEPDVLFPDWPRADLNLACLELLIGLIYLADPPTSVSDWKLRKPDPGRLRDAMKPLVPAFNLMGDGPCFLQDFEEISGSHNAPDMLFIDSAGESTAKKNADLMVKRDRYDGLEPALAAMALFTLQAFAPSGGAGNRTSMRGGGPMVTLVKPEAEDLWSLIWANVPEGVALKADELQALPWMVETDVSDQKQVKAPPEDEFYPPEVFFGQPRRLKLTADNPGRVNGVIQTPWGANYEGWVHPLSPYYHTKTGPLPKHPKPGVFGYRNWMGVVLQGEGADRAACLERYLKQTRSKRCALLVAGWAMSNMSPLDFLWSEAPVFALDDAGAALAAALVEAADKAGFALAAAVKQGSGEEDLQTGAANLARESFFVQTQTSFERMLDAIQQGQGAGVPDRWLAEMKTVALALFDAEVLPGLADLSETRRMAAVTARRNLLGAFNGHGAGRKLFQVLGMTPPKPARKTKDKT